MAAAIRILYVDDEPSLLDIGRMFLEQSGDFTVTTAISAPEGIRLLEREKFDAIISDYQMPGMDGIQFLVAVRTRFGSIPFILFTGRGREEVVIEAINNGVDFYLQKGGDPESQFAELSHKIKQASSRKKADDALRQSEEKYRHLIEHSDEAIVVVQDGMLRLVNYRTVEFTGYSEQELLSMSISAFIHPDDRAMVGERYQKRIKGEEAPSRYTFRIIPRDGGTRWVEISIATIEWEGHPATLNFLTEVTERKVAEDALRLFKDLVEHSSDAIGMSTPDGRHYYQNEAFNRMFGNIGDSPPETVFVDEAIGKQVFDTIRGGESWQGEVKMFGADGTILDIFLRAYAMQDQDGHIIGLVGLHTDITERRKAEEELRFSERKFAAAFEASPDPIAITDIHTGKILDINGTFEEWSGYLREEITGKTTRDLNFWVYPKERDTFVALLNKQGFVHKKEVTFRTKQGDFRTILFSAKVLGTGDNSYMLSLAEDITERKKAEEALRESRDRFKVTIASLDDAIFLVDPATRMISECNDAATRIFGYSHGQMVGMDTNILHVDLAHVEQFGREAKATYEDPGYYAREFEMRREDGSIFPSEHFVRPVRDPDGRILYVVSVVRDITERKRAEKVIHESEAQLKRAEEIGRSGSWEIRLNENTVSASDGAQILYGFEKTQSTIEEIQKVPLPRYRPLLDAALKDLITGKSPYNVEFKIRRQSDGTILDIHSVAEYDPGRNTVFGVIHDITERKKAEEALNESEEKYRTIFENAGDAIAIHDLKGNFVEVNDILCRRLGYCREELLTMKVGEVNDPVQTYNVEGQIQELTKSGHTIFEVVHITRDGRQIPTEVNAVLFYLGNKPFVMSIARDITGRKVAEEALKTSQFQLADAMDLAHLVNWEFDVATGIFTFDDRFYALYGTTAELEGGNQMPADVYAKKFVHPDDQYMVAEEVNNAIQATDPGYVSQVEHRIIRRDGEIRHIVVRFGITKDKNGRTIKTHGANQDITERKVAEKVIAESEEKFRATIRQSMDGILILDGDFNIIEWNAAQTAIYGYTKDEMLGRPVWEFQFATLPEEKKSPGLIEKMKQNILAIHTTTDTSWMQSLQDFDVQCKDGRRKTVQTSTFPIIFRDGKIFGSFSRDITERKRAEEALNDSENRYRTLVEHIPQKIFIKDRNSRYVSINENFANDRGNHPDEIVGKSDADLFPAKLAAKYRADDVRIMETGQTEEFEERYLNEGVETWVHTIKTVVRDKNGEASGVCGVFWDITDRKKAEEALRYQNEMRQIILDNIPVMVGFFDREGHYQLINRCWQSTLGWSLEEMLQHKDVFTEFYPDPEYRKYVMDYIRKASGAGHWSDFKTRIRDGRVLDTSWTNVPLSDGSIIGLGIDITDRKKAEETIRHALAEKEVLLQEVHHRVKNNLAGIIALINLQTSSLTDPAFIFQFKDLETRIRSMALVHESLCLTKDLARINVATYTDNLTRHLLAVYGDDPKIQCRIDMGDITMPIETAMPCGLVMTEIITNSLKYAFPSTFSCGEIRGEPCTISITMQREGSDYILTIADNGIGIPPGINVTVASSLGLYLIGFIISHQLQGSLAISITRGTMYTIRFPETKM